MCVHQHHLCRWESLLLAFQACREEPTSGHLFLLIESIQELRQTQRGPCQPRPLNLLSWTARGIGYLFQRNSLHRTMADGIVRI